MEEGLIHLYFGDGKGKTTAAIGLAVRAAGADKRVVLAQFLKGSDTAELNVLCHIPQITVLRNNEDFGFYKNMTDTQKEKVKEMHNATLDKITEMLNEGSVDMVILDEITYPYDYEALDKTKLEKLLLHKPKQVEFVLTGREPAPFFMKMADYATEMKKIRHPFDKNIPARRGIEW